ncbi:hypothetical protein [Spirosoma pollinicola]|uniref:hypothetical protein n=1 Tax=Spirosoma pollinicola TaxID=2057025 RepID=UPI0014766362|nr:hypothetical protein [Spirosoma pollinicola]
MARGYRTEIGFYFTMHLSDVVDLLILIELPASNWMFTPIIIATDTYIQDFTHLLNRKFVGMFLYKSQYLPSPLEKMLTAFFSISRSI